MHQTFHPPTQLLRTFNFQNLLEAICNMPSSNSLYGIDAVVAQRVPNKLFEGITAQHIVNELYLVVHLLALADKKSLIE
jgi:hypothetical protein